MTRMHVLPSEGGRSVTKSTPRCDQGRFGTGSGRSLPAGKWRGLLDMAQSGHPCTNLLTSLAILGHQKLVAARGCCWPLGGQYLGMSELSESGECVEFVERTDILEGSPADYWEQEMRRL